MIKKPLKSREIASYIDHTLLKPDASKEQITKLCGEASKYNFCSVCVNSSRVSLAAGVLKGTPVKVCAVVGFPLGAMESSAKGFEAAAAIAAGASEIDMVLNIGALKEGDHDFVENDIKTVRNSCGKGIILKVIIETCLLTDKEKKEACRIAVKAGADFVKTSTGFSTGGATEDDVRLMKNEVGDNAKVKASGGVRSYDDAVKMIDSGASRLGTSAGIAIIKGAEGTGNY